MMCKSRVISVNTHPGCAQLLVTFDPLAVILQYSAYVSISLECALLVCWLLLILILSWGVMICIQQKQQDVVQHSSVRYGTVQYSTLLYCAMYNAIHYKIRFHLFCNSFVNRIIANLDCP
jgi:hypothetical protein